MSKKTVIFVLLICFIMPVFAEGLELDPIAAEDIYETEDSQIISMDLLIPTEKITSKDIRRTKDKIQQSKLGLLPKREPLTVVIRGDGNYEIFDGNKTYTALKELGAKNVPVKILRLPYQKDIKTIDELYFKNSEVQAEFNSLMKSLSEKFGAELVIRSDITSRESTIVKAAELFNGDYSKILDVLAASLIFNSEEEIYNAVEKLKSETCFVSFYDSWNGQPSFPDAHHDYLTYVRLSNGIIAEIKLHHAAVYK